MEALGKVALVLGAISLVVGMVLRLLVREIAFGLAPSSFLEFSVALFLLTIALDVVGKKQ